MSLYIEIPTEIDNNNPRITLKYYTRNYSSDNPQEYTAVYKHSSQNDIQEKRARVMDCKNFVNVKMSFDDNDKLLYAKINIYPHNEFNLSGKVVFLSYDYLPTIKLSIINTGLLFTESNP